MFSQTVEYALRVAVRLAESDPKPRTADDLSRVTHVPRAYLAKVIQSMVRGGSARSKRGVGGGVTLAKPPHELTLLDVVNSVDSVKRLGQNAATGEGLDRLHQRCEMAVMAMETVLGEMSLAEIVADQKQTDGDSPATGSCANLGERSGLNREDHREAGRHATAGSSSRTSSASANGNPSPFAGMGEQASASAIGAS